MRTTPLLTSLLQQMLARPGVAERVKAAASRQVRLREEYATAGTDATDAFLDRREWPELLVDVFAEQATSVADVQLVKRAHEEWCRLHPDRARPLFEHDSVPLYPGE